MEQESTSRWFPWAAVLAGCGWFCFCAWVSWLRWSNYDIGIDTAEWAQTLHNGIHRAGWQYTCYTDSALLLSRNYYSMHFYNYLFPFSWAFMLVPHPLTLFFLQHGAHAVGGIAIGFLARRLSGGDCVFAILMMTVFFLHPAHARAQTAFDFNPRQFSLLFIPLAALAAEHGRHQIALWMLVALAAGEENLSLAAAFLSWTFLFRYPEFRTRYGVAGILLCLYTLAVLLFGLPAFLQDGFGIHFAGRYAHLKNGPLAWIEAVLTPANGKYLLSLLGPILLIPLLRPFPWLIAAVPFAAQNLLSLAPDTRLIGHHYTTPLSVALFLACLYGVCAGAPTRRRSSAGLMAGICLLLSVTLFPTLPYMWEGVDGRTAQLGANLKPIVEKIALTGSVSAPPMVCSHLWSREHLWFFPNGSREADWVVFPKFLLEYPAIDETRLRELWQEIVSDPGYSKIIENDDACLFQRRHETRIEGKN